MTRLTTPVEIETTFGVYRLDELIGEGGCGRVYGGRGLDDSPVAVKVLNPNVSTEKRRRFKNELNFLLKNRHPNIVSAIDHGLAQTAQIQGPFYVMARYQSSLRRLMANHIAPQNVLSYFSQILDGAEAAHLLGIIHRDLKPENILFDQNSDTLAVADFGAARFVEDLLVTTVETAPGQRLANFQYAAPEQRAANTTVGQSADIWALGMILNEMFTGAVPHGTDYQTISQVAPDFGFLDQVVRQAIKQAPGERQTSINEIKNQIMKYQFEAVTQQKLDQAKNMVIAAQAIDDDLALVPPQLISASWDRGQLNLTLDRPVSEGWKQAFYSMPSYRSLMGAEPGRFVFTADRAQIAAREHQAQTVVDYFKGWLPNASAVLKARLETAERERQRLLREQLQRELDAEEQNLRVNRTLRV